MKRFAYLLGMLALTAALFCVSALAAEPTTTGIRNVDVKTGYAIELQTAGGTAVTEKNTDNIYKNVAKIKLTIKNTTAGTFELAYMIKGEASTVPTESNLFYIEQQTGNGSDVEITMYPKEWESGTYTIVRINNNGTTATAATFEYYQAYTLGDLDGDTHATPDDALLILQDYVGVKALTDIQKLAGDINADGKADPDDALIILQFYVGIPIKYSLPK